MQQTGMGEGLYHGCFKTPMGVSKRLHFQSNLFHFFAASIYRQKSLSTTFATAMSM